MKRTSILTEVWTNKTLLCAFFWVIPRRLKFICWRFGTLCLFHLHTQVGTCRILHAPTCLWRWNRQSVPKCWHIIFRRWEITQKKAYNIQYKAKVWNQNKTFVTGRRSTLDRCKNIHYIMLGLQFGQRWPSSEWKDHIFLKRMAVQWQWIPPVMLSWSEISLYPNYADVDWISSSKTGQLPTLPEKLWPNYGGFLGKEVTCPPPPPPRSPDLSLCDFFLWGYPKGNVYVDKSRDIRQLQNAIERELCPIPRRMCEQVMTNFSRRLNECVKNKGRHLNDVIFHVWQFFWNITMVFLNCNISIY